MIGALYNAFEKISEPDEKMNNSVAVTVHRLTAGSADQKFVQFLATHAHATIITAVRATWTLTHAQDT
jgi:hypothetical protein